MENIADRKGWFRRRKNKYGHGIQLGKKNGARQCKMCCLPENSLVKATLNTEYTIKSVETNNDDVKSFLFSLGFYEGEKITVISAITNQYVVVIKDARYSIDTELAMCISVA